LKHSGITNVTDFIMENEQFFAGEPDIAQMRPPDSLPPAYVNETTPLIDEADGLLHQHPTHLTDDRPKWRRPSVSGYEVCAKSVKNNRLTCKPDRFGGCSHSVSFLPWVLVE
jgi:hypothetical protein